MRSSYFGSLCGLIIAVHAAVASPVPGTVINDGSTADTLGQLSSTNSAGDAVLLIGPNDFGSLTASQAGDAFFANRTVWFANNALGAGAVYTVAADFQPAADANPNRGGVMGWLNLATFRGIAWQVRPGEDHSFRLSVIDFTADNGTANESTTNLYQLDGSPAVENVNSAWSLADGYRADAFATFQLEFGAPTTSDRQALSNVTAHIFGKVFQAPAGSSNRVQLGRTVELLTDLPLPAGQNHRFGYFGFWGSVVLSGSTIGYLDNLTASGQIQSIANNGPTVRLVQPASNVTLPPGATLTVEAQASDTDGSIARVEFFFDNVLLTTATTPPFTTTISNLEIGQHPVRVRAVDNLGGSATSATVTVTVQEPIPGEPPLLEIATNPDGSLLISWPAGFEIFRLETSPSLLPGSWVTIDKSSATTAIVQPSEATRFYRLAAP